MVFLELKPNNPAIHKSINPSSRGMTVLCFFTFLKTSTIIGHDGTKAISACLNPEYFQFIINF
jgi:hypothetical protein